VWHRIQFPVLFSSLLPDFSPDLLYRSLSLLVCVGPCMIGLDSLLGCFFVCYGCMCPQVVPLSTKSPSSLSLQPWSHRSLATPFYQAPRISLRSRPLRPKSSSRLVVHLLKIQNCAPNRLPRFRLDTVPPSAPLSLLPSPPPLSRLWTLNRTPRGCCLPLPLIPQTPPSLHALSLSTPLVTPALYPLPCKADFLTRTTEPFCFLRPVGPRPGALPLFLRSGA